VGVRFESTDSTEGQTILPDVFSLAENIGNLAAGFAAFPPFATQISSRAVGGKFFGGCNGDDGRRSPKQAAQCKRHGASRPVPYRGEYSARVSFIPEGSRPSASMKSGATKKAGSQQKGLRAGYV